MTDAVVLALAGAVRVLLRIVEAAAAHLLKQRRKHAADHTTPRLRLAAKVDDVHKIVTHRDEDDRPRVYWPEGRQ